MYKVIKPFYDMQDSNHIYDIGETYPRKGLKVSDERLNELSCSENKCGTPLIKQVKSAKKKGAQND